VILKIIEVRIDSLNRQKITLDIYSEDGLSYRLVGKTKQARPASYWIKKAKQYNTRRDTMQQNNNNTDQVTVEQYREMLKRHDWFYQYADDFRAWNAGHDNHIKLLKLAETSPEHSSLYLETTQKIYGGK
jgi:hypothetical protein